MGSTLNNDGKGSRVGCRRMRSDAGTGPAREHTIGLIVPSKKKKKKEVVWPQTLWEGS